MIGRIKEYFKIARSTGFFYMMLGNVLCNFFTFLSNIILARIVEKGEYGIYTFANNTISYFLLFSGFGMVSGALLFCSRYNAEEEKMHAIFRYCVCRGMAVNFIMGIAIVIYGCFCKSSIQGAEQYILLMGFLPLVNVGLEFAGVYFRSSYKNKEYAMVYAADAVMLFGLSALGAGLWGAEGIILAGYFAPALSLFLALAYTDLKKGLKCQLYRLRPKEKMDIWKMSIMSMSSNAIAQLMHLIDISMIGGYMMEEDAVASYRIGMIIPSGLNFISSSVVAYIYPYFASETKDICWKRKAYKLLMLGLGAFNLFVSIFLFFAAPVLIEYIFGEQYLDAVIIFRILSINYFFQGTFRTLPVNLLAAQKKIKFCLFSNILAGILNIVGNYFMIPKLGGIGSAAATLLVMAFVGILLTAYCSYILKKGVAE